MIGLLGSVTTCRGRGHIVAAPLQAAQLVPMSNEEQPWLAC